MDPIQGFLCKLYYDADSSIASPTWTEIVAAKDVSEPNTADEVEVSARFSDGKKYIPGQFDQSIQFGYQYLKGGDDAVFEFLQDAFNDRTPIQIASTDGDIETTGTVGFKDWVVVTQFDTTEELAGSKTYAITFRPTPKFNAGAIVERTPFEV